MRRRFRPHRARAPEGCGFFLRRAPTTLIVRCRHPDLSPLAARPSVRCASRQRLLRASLNLARQGGVLVRGVAPLQWTVRSSRRKVGSGGSFRWRWVIGNRGRSGAAAGVVEGFDGVESRESRLGLGAEGVAVEELAPPGRCRSNHRRCPATGGRRPRGSTSRRW